MKVSGLLHAPAAFHLGRELPVAVVGPRSGPQTVKLIKISYPCQDSTLNSSALLPVARRYTD
jgi:hypothetical protein